MTIPKGHRPTPGPYNTSYPFGAPNGPGKTHLGGDYGDDDTNWTDDEPIECFNSGKVIYVRKGSYQWDPLEGGYGAHVVVDHGTYHTLYAHFSKVLVVNGQSVSKSQLLGFMGQTGWATGRHLHFEIFDQASGIYTGNRVNPNFYFEQEDQVTTEELIALNKKIDNVATWNNAVNAAQRDDIAEANQVNADQSQQILSLAIKIQKNEQVDAQDIAELNALIQKFNTLGGNMEKLRQDMEALIAASGNHTAGITDG